MAQENVCRLCLSTDVRNFSIFSEKGIRMLIESKILDYLSFRLRQNDGLPNGVCDVCLNRLNDFDEFARKVYLIQKKLKNDFKVWRHTTIEFHGENHATKDNFNKGIHFSEANHNETANISKLTKRRTSSRIGIQNKVKEEFTDTISEDDNSCDIDEVKFNNEDDFSSEHDVSDKTKSTLFDASDFPSKLIKDCKLTITGNRLYVLLAKFFNLECYICTQAHDFKTLSSLFDHYTETHNTKGYVLCCGHKLLNFKSMAMHMASHLQPEAFTCDTCGKRLTCPRILQYHKQNHLPEAKRPLGCSQANCERRFSYYSALVAHQHSHLPENERKTHVCDECGKIFSTSSRLSTHTSKMHKPNGDKFVCHICAQQFTNSSNLEYHLSTHQHRMSNQVQCTECGKWSKNKLCLAKHMVQHRPIPFACEHCTYTSRTRQGLRSHIQVRHSKDKLHSCQTCGKTFKLKCTLKAHLAQHTGERKYQCTFCTRSFVNSGNFYAHRKRMHSTQLKDYYDERNRKEHEERLRIMGLELEVATTT